MAAKQAPLVALKGLSHIVIRVRDLDRALGFYQRVFGFQIFSDHRHPHGDGEARQAVIGGMGGMAIEFLQSSAETIAKTPRLERDAPGVGNIAFSVADVGAALERLKAEGLTRFAEPVAVGAGAKVILFRDPDGNILELIQNAGKTIYETGMDELARQA